MHSHADGHADVHVCSPAVLNVVSTIAGSLIKATAVQTRERERAERVFVLLLETRSETKQLRSSQCRLQTDHRGTEFRYPDNYWIMFT